jgi:hypothetical protein
MRSVRGCSLENCVTEGLCGCEREGKYIARERLRVYRES